MMKQLKLTFLLTVLMSMVGARAFAYDIAVENADGVTIYYNKRSNNELVVTCKSISYIQGQGQYSSRRFPVSEGYEGVETLRIPAYVSVNGESLKVVEIDDDAFENSNGLGGSNSLKNLIIPETVKYFHNFPKDAYFYYGYSSVYGWTYILDYRPRSINVFVQINNMQQWIGNGGSRYFDYDVRYKICDDIGVVSDVVIPNGVRRLPEEVFMGCKMSSVTIPNSVVAINRRAFYYCENLLKVISLIENPFPCVDNIFYNYHCTLYVPVGTKEKYKAETPWKYFDWIEEGTPTGINEIKEDVTGQNRYYDLNGNLLLQPRKGVNIVKSSDGKTKKIVVK